MNTLCKTMAYASANLLALGFSATDATLLKPVLASSSSSDQSRQSRQSRTMNEAEMRATEASHLEVYAGCKWGHAAFDPVKVESEELSAEVQAVYGQLSA